MALESPKSPTSKTTQPPTTNQRRRRQNSAIDFIQIASFTGLNAIHPDLILARYLTHVAAQCENDPFQLAGAGVVSFAGAMLDIGGAGNQREA
jgi:hypothetical protein